MERKYHRWSSDELLRVRKHVRECEYPSSPYHIDDLSKELGLGFNSVRGAVVREMQRQKNDIRER